MTIQHRHAIISKIESCKVAGLTEKSSEIRFLRRELRLVDRLLLEQEVERLAREKRLSFQGDTLQSRLGFDAWLLS